MKNYHLCGIIAYSLIAFIKNYNISIYNNAIKQQSIFISNTLIPYITIEFNDLLLLQKDYFLLKILYLQFKVYTTYINSYIMRNSFSKLKSYINDKCDDYINNLFELISINILEPHTVYSELYINIKTKINYLFDSLYNKLLTEELIKDILYESHEQIKLKEAYIVYFKNKIKLSQDYIDSFKNNEIFYSVKDSKISKYNNKYYNYNLKLRDSKNNNNMNYIKMNNFICNLLLIIFSIINIIYIEKFTFLIENKIISVYALSFEFIVLGITHQGKNLFFYYSFIEELDSKESLFIKLFYLSGFFLSFINLECEIFFVMLFLFDKLAVEEGTTPILFRLFPVVIIQLLDDYKYTKNIKLYLIWYLQIVNNIIYNNKYTYPLFYIIICTIDKLILIFLANIKENDNSSPSILKLLIFIGISIIIIYFQALYGPRFMLNSKYQQNNQKYYLSKEELIKLKPKVKYKTCPICLMPLFDENKIKKDNELNLNNNSNDNFVIRAKNKVLNIYIYKEFIKKIFKIGFFDFYEFDIQILKKYMIIPCGHFYHSICLKKWIKIESNCPLCREYILNP